MGEYNALYTIGKAILPLIFKPIYRYKVINKNNIPKDGGYIIACNHLSFSDPILLGVGQRRRIFFMAKDELFKNKFFSSVIRTLGAFPVKRGAGDGKAIATGEDLVRQGKVMGIFIEGGRSKTGDFMRPRSGCALLAQQTGVPVIPACITIKAKNFKRPFAKRIVHFGEPLTNEDLGLVTGDRRELKNASNMIMDKIKEMRERDLYGD